MHRLSFIVALLLHSSLSFHCSLIVTGPSAFSQEQRDANFPLRAPLENGLTIYWNENRIPFIEAESEEDLAMGIGLLHAHLRGGQLQVFRRVSQGRLAESFGPLAADIDHTLRIINFGRATNGIIAGMDPDTRRYVDAYIRGLNFYLENQEQRWPTLDALGIEAQPWTIEDLVTVWRLFSVDVNWFRFYQALSDEERAPEHAWKEMREKEEALYSYGGLSPEGRMLAGIFFSLSRSGSNSLVIDGSRSRSGSPMIASDPHVGLILPPLWIIMGVRSPEVEAVGMTIPGLPILALGRSRHITWGGTNMWGISTSLVALEPEELEKATVRTDTISIASWPDRQIEIRDTKYGPVLSDSPVFADAREKGYRFAIAWTGHQVSDELTTYRKILRAKSCTEFRQAFASWAVSAQNYLCADTEGNIEHVLAYRRPVPGAEVDILIRGKSDLWTAFQRPTELPFRRNPPEGFLSSANDRPAWSPVKIGYFFSPPSRTERMAILMQSKPVGIEELKKLQMDSCSPLALRGRDALLTRMKALGLSDSATDPDRLKELRGRVDALGGWDGCYKLGSSGAMLYESIMSRIRLALEMPAENGEAWVSVMAALDENPEGNTMLLEAALHANPHETWSLSTPVAGPLSNIPLIGGRWVLQKVEEDGGTQTLYKRGFVFENDEARVTYGANARHISDLADPNANYFVLFGGQDGIMQSPTTTDQVDLWIKGELIQIPLDRAELETWKRTLILPRASGKPD